MTRINIKNGENEEFNKAYDSLTPELKEYLIDHVIDVNREELMLSLQEKHDFLEKYDLAVEKLETENNIDGSEYQDALGARINARFKYDRAVKLRENLEERAPGAESDIIERLSPNDNPKDCAALTDEGDIAYTQGINHSAYTAVLASAPPQGEPKVDLDQRTISVGDTPITAYFADIAIPDMDNIKLLDARLIAPEEQSIAPTMDEHYTVSL